jgi:3-dehydroquinate synthase
VETTGREFDDIAQEIERLAGLRCVAVPLASRSYSVWIGAGLEDIVERYIRSIAAGHVVMVVTDSNVEGVGGSDKVKQLQASGQRVVDVVLPAGEAHKTLASVERIWDAALAVGINRGDLVVGVGGGVVGDLAGFAAATLLRGVQLGHLPTTLLSMVDSSVGGKTGFDRPEGKNLIGAFYQPRFVICDLRWLSTLPKPELQSGLAEVVKAAWIAGPAQVEFLETQAENLLAGDEQALAQAVHMAVTLKAQVVAADERESGLRMLLNLGHTVGHAIEALQDFRGMRHGEAVALGMVASAQVGAKLGISSLQNAQRLQNLLQRLGLSTDVSPWLKEPRLFQFLAADKKRAAQMINYVVAGAPGSVETIPLPLEKLQKLLTT